MVDSGNAQMHLFGTLKHHKLYSSRFQGSKRRIMPWLINAITSHVNPGEKILDAYTGSGLVTYALASRNYRMCASDQLLSSVMTVRALSGQSRDLETNELDSSLKYASEKSEGWEISENYKGIFFPQDELIWLERMSSFIRELPVDAQPRAFWALFQSALAKRPYNLFHRANLEMRTRSVPRSFGNKATWEKPFPLHFQKFLHEASTHALNLDSVNVFHGDPLSISNSEFKLVYLDPPYINEKGQATPYVDYYGFLDLLIDPSIMQRVNMLKSNKPIEPITGGWKDGKTALQTIEKVLQKFEKSKIALSYRNDGQPKMTELVDLFENHRGKVSVYSTPLKYALSTKANAEEILLVSD
jgi:adenine-specific DNA methylase